MESVHAKNGRKGAKKFWKMYKADPLIREKIKKSRQSRKDSNWIKEASLLGVEARRKNIEEKENKDKKRLYKLLQKEDNVALLSRLCGFISGDGNIAIRKENKNNFIHYEIRFYPDHKELAQIFTDTFTLLYNKKPSVKKHKTYNYFIVRVSSKIACEHLLDITAFSTHSWTLPKKILSSNKSKVEFLRAFFDCEGSVGKRNIQVQSVNGKGLKSLQTLLQGLGINSSIYQYERDNPNWKTNYMLVVSRKENIKRFLEMIGFNHPAKQEKLRNMPACQNG